MTPDERRQQYAADITYGTNNEFGFDYLRDNMAWSHGGARAARPQLRDRRRGRLDPHRRGPHAADHQRPGRPGDQVVRRVRRASCSGSARDVDYEVDEKKRTVGILEPGVERVEDYLGIENLYESANTPLVGYLNNALKAKELFKRDKDYVVMNGEVLIVDEYTGRILAGRRYNEGMHQAIEAKEGVEIKQENQTLATITLQNFFRLYDKLSGMTGTAMTEAAEFSQIYKLGVVPIPTNMPMVRADQADLVYKTEDAKFAAVVDDIAERHEKGQPVLVGTASVEKSEHLSSLLKKRGVQHEVLNAKHHEREAAIVAQAGRHGRGHRRHQHGRPRHRHHARRQPRVPRRPRAAGPRARPGRDAGGLRGGLARGASSRSSAQVAAEHDEVIELGGLYVLGTERHESRRIDNQLRGRSGRQGDPGESRFYLSLGDDLMRLFNAAMVENFLTRFNIPEDVPIESKMVTNAIRSAQTQVEAQNFEIRKNVLKYDEVLNRQRTVIYDERRQVLEGEDLHEQVRHMIDDVVEGYVDGGDRRGLRRGLGPRPALDRAQARSTRCRSPSRSSRRPPAATGPGLTARVPRRGAARPTRRPRTTRARRRSAPRSCASSSAASSSPCSTASGASTSTRWTTCRRASACGRWPSATRWSSTSARASTCSPR